MSLKFNLSCDKKIWTLLFLVHSIYSSVIMPSNMKSIVPLKKLNNGGMFRMNYERAVVTHASSPTTHSSGVHNNVNSTSSNNGGHSSDPYANASGGHGSSSSAHHVPPPSYQLHPNTYHFKPENFNLLSKKIGINQLMVGFTYPVDTHYDRYIFQIRYHGFESYMTSKLKLNRTEVNYVMLNGFLDAQYVVCVTLFSSSGLPEYKPISTSDMCLDVTIGESHTPGGHHSSTGYLTPLLVVVAAVLLAIIAIGDSIIHSRSNDHKKSHDSKPKIVECRAESNLSKLNASMNASHQYHSNRAFSSDIDSSIQQIKKPNIEIRYEDKSLTSSQTLRHVLDDKPWIINQQRSNLT